MKRRKIKKILNADKIAAGEVVERPMNVVKELIENSIDAGAKEIRVIIKKAGKLSIQVIDDGIGMLPDEIDFAFKRHTSSKIRSIEDLNTLSTLGFRGEALASIAAVSQVEITSRTEKNERGVQLFIDGGILVNKKEIDCPIGTNIKVKRLFFNIPARQKFLKSDSTELGHITNFIQRYSLAYSELHFIYIHNDLNILNCPADNDLKTTVFHIYGNKIAKFMEPINHVEEGESFKLHGLLGHPEISKKSRTYSSLFINRRYVINDVLFRAIKEAYKDILMINKHPFFILFLEIDPSVVDFNIHPTKLHVRFENEKNIYNKLYNIVRNHIKDKFVMKEIKYLSTELSDYIGKRRKDSTFEGELDVKEIKRPIKEIRESKEKEVKTNDFALEGISSEKAVQLRLTDEDIEAKLDKNQLPETYIREKYIISKNFPKLRLISYTGQMSNKVYIVLEGINDKNEEGLYIMDQHAASERVNKEYFLNMYETLKISKQQLISPLKIDVSPSEKFFLQENLSEIKKLGFNFEPFGGNTFILRETPSIMGKTLNIDLINDIISDITSIGKDKAFLEIKEEIINYLACHKSIRGGDDLSLKDIRNLLIDLSNCKDPYHCAHGRPTLRFVSFKELDKLFKRII
ncbi:MAG: DNA mismatch repair endonuclease MutL [Promethearchaeota archaeon]